MTVIDSTRPVSRDDIRNIVAHYVGMRDAALTDKERLSVFNHMIDTLKIVAAGARFLPPADELKACQEHYTNKSNN